MSHDDRDSSSRDGSIFRIGDNVELSRVLLHVSILVLFILAFKGSLHHLSRHLEKHPKYLEMVTKLLGELTILGFISIAIKTLKEVAHLDAYSKNMIAVQVADILVFLVALVLIVQAVIILLQLHFVNIEVDKAELVSTLHVVELIRKRRESSTWYSTTLTWFSLCIPRRGNEDITALDLYDVARMRILRHFFLMTKNLPKIFPFSKYLRQAQDNLVNRIVEIGLCTWMVLLLVGWGITEVSAQLEKRMTDYDSSYATVAALFGLMRVTFTLHMMIHLYFVWAKSSLVDAAVGETRENDQYLKKLQAITF